MPLKIGTGISFDKELLEKIDKKRGYVSRSAFIVGIVQNELEEEGASVTSFIKSRIKSG
jgi:metal-responsive CopG/Arc/MetJ family transcriptional regulator